jgi:hypothetical protein
MIFKFPDCLRTGRDVLRGVLLLLGGRHEHRIRILPHLVLPLIPILADPRHAISDPQEVSQGHFLNKKIAFNKLL